ncbi:Dihydroxyacetone kinase 2 [Cadophora gregata]|uniref:Dihydroxyacetone kinase 2 n=1 Tax=Cadophora gregata TaxID=51156 RepID=UPI0026DC0ABD|nr:Dihydroxyacetone kinase 2 [Cadophora gregata]KAK0118241.1 Dihydroxyacetone kinase 2 [Cadophora gregata]KAK0123315.1 Dihydroxyacetone kinase 2 [Cadophora gregata f. sp. sojae]
MSLIVEQTIPYSPSQLKLDDPKRWSRLFPLMRPSTKVVETASGQAVVIDTALAKSRDVLIAAVGNLGNLSSKILNESHLAAFTVELSEKAVSTQELVKVLKDSGFPVENGVLVIRTGTKQDLKSASGVAEHIVEGELKFDHALSLLLAAKPEVKASFEETQELLGLFVKATAKSTSKFHEQKTGDAPSVTHGDGVVAFKSAKSSIDKDLSALLASTTSTGTGNVYSVHYSDINGLSRLENNILAHEISKFLANKKIEYYITQSTIVNKQSPARGWSISLCAVPSKFLAPQVKATNALANSSGSALTKPREFTSKLTFSDPQVRKVITAGCERVIKEEPTITEYDTIVGDGDCGYTLRDGAKQVLSYISKADLSKLPSTLSDLVDDLEVNMGGTSGALYCIFLSSLAQSLQESSNFAEALDGALQSLLKYTRARLGDRTCLDCLIPFVETLTKTGDSKKALVDAEKGVDITKNLEAKLGRSSYLDESTTRGVPDPGAYGLLMLLEGMVGAL